ncbi:acyltransferase family protein [Candidatus Saccharibacteria bacterium]|nr:acyltransferase family protein [Candidatus Saccharibacteria bacterium]
MKRILYFDTLRIIAMISVIFVHVSAQNWYAVDIFSRDWTVFNFFDSLSRFGVPIFVMISGALFLRKDQPIEKIYKKNILRLVVIFFAWSLIYVLYQFFVQKDVTSPSIFISRLLKGPYHLWFLFMIIGLYMITPFLRKIVVDKKLTKYFLLLALIFAFILPKSIDLIGIKFPLAYETIEYMNKKLGLVIGYSGYFVLGYVLSTIKIPKKTEYILYILGFIGFLVTFIATCLLSRYENSPDPLFYGNLTLNVLVTSIAIFVFFKKHFHKIKNKKTEKTILFLSKCSLGIYLVHVLILFVLDDVFNINTLSFNPILSVPALGFLVTSASFLISIFLNKIPIVNKWLV